MKKIKNTTGKICLSSTRFLYPEFKKNIDQNTREVLKSGFYILGEKNKKLEQRLSKYLNVKFFTTVATGTDALTIAVKALSLGKDDEVIVPANVYPSVFGIALSGVRIRLADVDEDSLNISPEAIEKTINKNTKVIVLVHLYGNPANITDIKKIAKKIKLLRMYGEKKRYESVLVGHNSRFDEIQAGILLAQLDDLDLMNNKRRKIAKEYIKSLKNLPIKIIEENKDGKGVYHLFVIRTNQRNKLADYLNRGGIEIGIHYPNPIHLTKGFKYLGYRKGDFPVSEIASSQILSIPVHPFLTNKQVLYICSSIKEFFRK